MQPIRKKTPKKRKLHRRRNVQKVQKVKEAKRFINDNMDNPLAIGEQ